MYVFLGENIKKVGRITIFLKVDEILFIGLIVTNG